MKRDIIKEIDSIRTRSEFNSREDYVDKLYDIKYTYQENLSHNKNFDKELLKYIPIATVACFEAFFRSVYKELIDFGRPFSDNVTKFNKAQNVKFNFEIVNAIQTKKVTVGEFISHILPCNNFSNINNNLTTLCNVKFAKEIKKFKRNSVFEHVTDNSKYFIANSNQIMTDIHRIFELRHIFCHEFATNLVIDKDEISRCLKHAIIFLIQSNDFIWELIYPNAPETQSDMNTQVFEEYKSVKKELTDLVLFIKETKNEGFEFIGDMDLFDKSIEQWENYRKIKAESDAYTVLEGTMYQLLYTNSLINTTKEKIESLKNEFKID